MSINLQNFQVKSGSFFTTLNPFPVGYIYMSTSSTSPASIYGGTWQSLTDGKFLRPNGSWNSTGGANSHKHNLDIAYALIGAIEGDRTSLGYHAVSSPGGDTFYNLRVIGTGGFEGNWSNSQINHSTQVVGITESVSNIPAYRTCYCWYRSA